MAKLCPKCKNELERLRSCGSESYFCNHCNELVSRSAVIDTEATTKDDKKTPVKEER